MRIFAVVMCLIVAWAPSSAVGDTATLRKLTDATFEHDTQAATGATTGDWFVMFHSPKCPHCKKALPLFEEFAHEYDKHHTILAEIDCVDNGKTCRRFNVFGYPSFLLFRRGRFYEFEGERNKEEWENFLLTESRTVEGKTVPPPQGFLDDVGFYVRLITRDLSRIAQQDARVLITVSVGLLLLLLVVIWKATQPLDVDEETKKQ